MCKVILQKENSKFLYSIFCKKMNFFNANRFLETVHISPTFGFMQHFGCCNLVILFCGNFLTKPVGYCTVSLKTEQMLKCFARYQSKPNRVFESGNCPDSKDLSHKAKDLDFGLNDQGQGRTNIIASFLLVFVSQFGLLSCL